jgi:hypothetical protein
MWSVSDNSNKCFIYTLPKCLKPPCSLSWKFKHLSIVKQYVASIQPEISLKCTQKPIDNQYNGKCIRWRGKSNDIICNFLSYCVPLGGLNIPFIILFWNIINPAYSTSILELRKLKFNMTFDILSKPPGISLRMHGVAIQRTEILTTSEEVVKQYVKRIA